MCPPFFVSGTPFGAPGAGAGGPQISQNTVFALITSNAPKIVEQGSKLVDHYRTHPGGYVKTIQTLRKFNWPFLSQKRPFLGASGAPW